MLRQDFRIGGYFQSAGGTALWVCTDIGTRVVVAVRIDRAEIVESSPSGQTQRVADIRQEPDLFDGPPYMLCEVVFDEYDFESCEAVSDPTAWSPL